MVLRVLLGELYQALHLQPLAHGRADAGALEVQCRRADVPAPVLLAHQVLCGHPHVIEEDLAEAGVAGHVHQRPHRDPRRLHIEHEVADPLVLGGVRVRACEHEHPVGGLGAGRPDLLSVDHVVVAVALRPRLERSEVRAGARLAEPLAPLRLTREDAAQVLLLLLLSAVDDQRRADHSRAHAAHQRRPVLRELLVHDELLHDGKAGAAVLLRPGRRDPALVRQLRPPSLHLLEARAHVAATSAAAAHAHVHAHAAEALR